MNPDLQKLVTDEFGGTGAQIFYGEKASDGLWISEAYFIQKYFTQKTHAPVLDIGCGTGRTTIPLVEARYEVVGIDLVPQMIDTAKRIAQAKELTIDYRMGDATQLDFPDNSFSYAVFSNQGLTQIPGRMRRITALREIHRVLRPGGILLFSAHPRSIWFEFPFWVVQWIRFFILKQLGVPIPEKDFGDRFFEKELSDHERTYEAVQYIHFPTVSEMRKDTTAAGFKVLEADGTRQISKEDIRPHPPVIYVCQK